MFAWRLAMLAALLWVGHSVNVLAGGPRLRQIAETVERALPSRGGKEETTVVTPGGGGGIDAMFQEGTDAALDDQVRRHKAAQK